MPPANSEAAHLSGEDIRFSFGENWQHYLRGLDAQKIKQAQDSLSVSFGGAELSGRTFLDIGCGSGLFSLAARNLGAIVTSVDVDPASVACTTHLGGGSADWSVIQGSILEDLPLRKAELVYAWGSLHHTGAMWEAVNRALTLVAPGGLACLALYTRPSRLETHMKLKRLYNRLPGAGKGLLKYLYGGRLLALMLLLDRRNPIAYVRTYGESSRGMTFWRDVDDWLGGLPFDYTDADEFRSRMPEGFEILNIIEGPPASCTEYLLRRKAE